MNADAKTIYRVHVEGLSPTERTVFGGMIHLAERNGTHFQIEASLENSDIFILDGSDQHSVEFSHDHSQIAQRAIWIDPPAHLQSARQVKRPLRWSTLLQMMEQIVGGSFEPAAAAIMPNQPVIKLVLDQLCGLGESILRAHIGIAAEFVVDDVRAEIKARGGASEQIATDVFLDILKRQLPTNVDAGKIIHEISTAVAQGRTG
jgi:hypothetical protein